jgi:hypothetical protein
VRVGSAYVVSSYSSKLSNEDKATEKAPLPTVISAPQPVNTITAAALALPPPAYASDKQWAAASRTSVDESDNSDDEDGEDRLDPGPPAVPILDPAPPKRIPRIRPAYPSGMGPASRDSEIIVAKDKSDVSSPPSLNPFVDAAAVALPAEKPVSAIDELPHAETTTKETKTEMQNPNPFTDAGAIV